MSDSTASTLEEMLDELAQLVSIESPSRELPALEASAAAVAELLERHTGRAASIVDSEAGPHVHWSGGGTPRVLLLGHHDTVFPLGTLAERPFVVTDGRATGPGVFDMKAGIVLAARALAELRKDGGGGMDAVECLFTCDEEVGSESSRALVEERASACGAVLVLEPSADGGRLKTGRKGCGVFEVVASGKAAHAGLEPEAGDNALVELAHQVIDIAALGRPDVGTTVTPTVASAGTADNVVPASATVRVDVRVESDEEGSRVEGAMAALRARDANVRLDIRGGIGRPPMPTSASTSLFAVARDVAAAAGLAEPAGVAVGGGSDGNFTAALGIPTLDGLGAVGGGAHADHEWVDVTELGPRLGLLVGLLQRLATWGMQGSVPS